MPDDFGFTVKEFSFDLKKIVERSRKVANQLSSGVKFLMKKNKIEVVDGAAKLLGKGKVEVTAKDGKKTELAAKNIIIATGARARALPGLEADGKLIWTYKEAMVPEAMPKSLLVVGSGAIGIEFASFLPHAGRRSDGGRGDGSHFAGGRRRSLRFRAQGVRKAGHEDHHRRRRSRNSIRARTMSPRRSSRAAKLSHADV